MASLTVSAKHHLDRCDSGHNGFVERSAACEWRPSLSSDSVFLIVAQTSALAKYGCAST